LILPWDLFLQSFLSASPVSNFSLSIGVGTKLFRSLGHYADPAFELAGVRRSDSHSLAFFDRPARGKALLRSMSIVARRIVSVFRFESDFESKF
jgi:hypothetical protein